MGGKISLLEGINTRTGYTIRDKHIKIRYLIGGILGSSFVRQKWLENRLENVTENHQIGEKYHYQETLTHSIKIIFIQSQQNIQYHHTQFWNLSIFGNLPNKSVTYKYYTDDLLLLTENIYY